MNNELLLRNSSVIDTLPLKSDRQAGLNENAELIKQEQLTKNKVKLNLLETMLAHSRKQLKGTENDEVQRKMTLVEEREYLRATVDPSTYFKGLFKQLQENHPNMPAATQKINSLNDKISEKIIDGTIVIGPRIIPPKKEELNGLIRSKLLNGSSPDLINDSRIMRSHLHRSVDTSIDKSRFSDRPYDPKLLLKKLKIETEQVKQLVEERRKKTEQRYLQEEQQQEQKKLEDKKNYHDLVVKEYEEQRLLQQQRVELAKKNQIEFLKFQKQYQEKKPLYKIMEEEYKQKFEIEVQKEKLNKLRELYKPHKSEDFLQHFQKYQEFQNSETERLEQKRNAFKSTLSLQGHPQLWRGKVHEYVEDEIKNSRLMSASEDRKVRQARQKTYGDMVKANYVPRIDEDKQKEINKRNSEFNMPKSIVKKLLLKHEIASEPNSYKLGLDYMEFAKKLVREHAKQPEEGFKPPSLDIEGSKPQLMQIQVDLKSNSSNPSSFSSRSPYKNYMREERVKSQLKKEDPKKEWENNMTKFQGIERVEKVLQEAQKLDLQAYRKEKIIRCNKHPGRSTDMSDLDDCYFNSIKAKIAILKGVSDY